MVKDNEESNAKGKEMKSRFGDSRLDKRLAHLQAALSEKPCGKLTEALKVWSGLKAGYRFLK